jgi:hypothetical protein
VPRRLRERLSWRGDQAIPILLPMFGSLFSDLFINLGQQLHHDNWRPLLLPFLDRRQILLPLGGQRLQSITVLFEFRRDLVKNTLARSYRDLLLTIGEEVVVLDWFRQQPWRECCHLLLVDLL